ncbi:MAG: PDZ domain-containing protein [Pirellulaceae bacterium]|nr:PDZ domain-containing protein [Pirellulaceae bacterium]
MNVVTKKLLVAGLFVVALALGGTAQAQTPKVKPYLLPQPGVGGPVRLGFQGHFAWGQGMVVDFVPWGTPASQAGLEPGDVIRAINGQWIQSQAHYFWLLQNSGGQVNLRIRDWRTGMLVSRTVWINGPIAAYSAHP